MDWRMTPVVIGWIISDAVSSLLWMIVLMTVLRGVQH